MSDSEIILHHYASSPFSEKVRLALGLKGLTWKSVEIAALPPRPLLTPLVGGYRRVPVMQIGADFYCDTNIILPTLDRLHAKPPLFPGVLRGLSQALAFNWERSIWLAAIGVRAHFANDAPAPFLKDRKEDYLYVDISKAAMEPTFDLNLQRVRAQIAWLVETLADGRRFLLGDEPGALDLAYYHPLWLIREGGPVETIDAQLGTAPILAWYERVADLGHGDPVAMDAEAAWAEAEAAMPALGVSGGDEGGGPQTGTQVSVTPDDFARVPVHGMLLAVSRDAIVIRRDDSSAGAINLHFPRAGFELRAA